MISLELVDPQRLHAFFAEIEPELYRFPAVDPRVVSCCGGAGNELRARIR